MATPTTETKTKFQSIIEKYDKYLTEGGFPPLAPVATPAAGGGGTNTAQTSAVDQAVDTDPNVVNARRKAADAVALQAKQRANTITNPQ